MKKLIVVVMLIALSLTACFALTACNDETETHVEKIEAQLVAGTLIHVGDEFDSTVVTITATLSDGTETTVTNTAGFTYDTSKLNLDKDGKFTEAGALELTVTYVNKYSTTLTLNVLA